MAVTEITSATHGCGKTLPCWVKIPADLSHTGEEHWAWKPVDKCLAPMVDMLNAHGYYTRACCCGHGKAEGNIMLQDGTTAPIARCPFYT